MKYRLGLDIGANSIGWCILDIDEGGEPTAIRDVGARIFSDGRNPKDKTSLAVARRQARQMRRRRDRYLRRRGRFMNALVRFGFMPRDETERKSLERLDPYELRVRGLDERLDPFELGRALFHLNQRRGFKSNMKIDKSDEKESGKIRSAGDRLRALLEETGTRTLGEFLAARHENKSPVRVRLQGEGAKAIYDFYPQRDMIAAEFGALWTAQATHHPALMTDAARETLSNIMLYQRPLKPVRSGKCTLIPTEERAPAALPLAQRRRIYEEVNHLRVEFGPGQTSRSLTLEERDAIVGALLQKQKQTFHQIRRLLKFDSETVFNTESEKRKHLDGDKTAHVMARKDLFGPDWRKRDIETQTAIIERLLDEEIEEKLAGWLCQHAEIGPESARKIASARLPDGHSRLGRTALSRVLPELERAVIPYSEAVQAAGFTHHSDFRDGEIHDFLPYYGARLERHVAFGSGEPDDPAEKRVGRIANPTVHIGLNQLRKLVNAIIDAHGHPDEVVIELGRDLKNSIDKQRDIEKLQTENQKKNDERRARLVELGVPDTGENRMKLRLWEELGPPQERHCVYTGEPISIAMLLSDQVEIDHILPFSKTLDNSAANKTVSLRRANREKTNKSPYEAFHDNPKDFEWEKIAARGWDLPRNKSWRFAPDAMAQFEARGGFLDRHLADTQYLTRISREYLTAICDPNKVWTVPGKLTAMLRGKWGLNSLLSDHNRKNRTDHRHHAVDAAVVALTDPGLLNKISRAAARAEESGIGRILDDMPEPWEGFRDDLGAALRRTVVTHKQDHGKQGRLHNDTAYGLASDPDDKGVREVVHRKMLLDLKSRKDIDTVRDLTLRGRINEAVLEGEADGLTLRESLARFSRQTGVRRVRVLERLRVIPIENKAGYAYKGYKGDSNHCYDIFDTAKGRWIGQVVTAFEANANENPSAPPLATRGVMRLRKDDLIAIGDEDDRRVMRVVKFSPGQIVLADHHEGGNLKQRDAMDDEEDPFRYLTRTPNSLRDLFARKVHVDILGRVRDPGPPA